MNEASSVATWLDETVICLVFWFAEYDLKTQEVHRPAHLLSQTDQRIAIEDIDSVAGMF